MNLTALLGRRRLLTLVASAALLGFVDIARADGPEILAISVDGARVTFTEEQFAALPQSEVTTSTRWTEGVVRFNGVLLRDVLSAAGLDAEARKGHTLELRASNDYVIEIPAEDADAYRTLVARQMDGVAMQRDEKGPLWLVYPRDDHAELDDQRYDHRWAWQLVEITLR